MYFYPETDQNIKISYEVFGARQIKAELDVFYLKTENFVSFW